MDSLMHTEHSYARRDQDKLQDPGDLEDFPHAGYTCEVPDREAAFQSCIECNLNFENIEKFEKHEHYHALVASSEVTMRIFSCRKCGFMSRKEENLNRHLREEHAKSENTTSRIVLKAVIPMLFLIKDVQCDGGRTQQTCLNPSESKKITKTIDRGKLFQRLPSLRKVLAHKRYPCTNCGKVFARKCSLHTHNKVHRRHPYYMCHQCEGRPTFATLSEWTKHVHSIHGHTKTKEKPLCELCRKQFISSSMLQQHHKFAHKKFKASQQPYQHLRRHTNFLPSACEVCGCKFSEKSNCRKHVQSNKGLAFCCQVCGKSYTRKSYLNKHLITHKGDESCDLLNKASAQVKHDERRQSQPSDTEKKVIHFVKVQQDEVPLDQRASRTGKRLYDCDICGKSFTSSNVQKRHRFVHFKDMKLFSCSRCDKSFHTRFLLNQHSETHNTEKKYKCLECGKGFKTRTGWHTHKYVHKAICWKCKVCGKMYRDKSVSSHISSLHREELSTVSHWKYLCEKFLAVEGQVAPKEGTSPVISDLHSQVIEEQSAAEKLQVIEEQCTIQDLEVIGKQSVIQNLQVIKEQCAIQDLEVIKEQSAVQNLQVIEEQCAIQDLPFIEEQSALQNLQATEEVYLEIPSPIGAFEELMFLQ